MKSAFQSPLKIGDILSLPKELVTVGNRQDTIYKISCENCNVTYIDGTIWDNEKETTQIGHQKLSILKDFE